MGNWQKTTLGETILLQRGHDLPIQQRVFGTVPVVASTEIVGYHNQAMADGPGVVIGRSGSLGGGQFIRESFWPLNTTLYVKDFKGNNPRFIYYLLRNINFSQFNVGSGVPTLNRNHIHPLPVRIPSLEEQNSIAGLLGLLDDKIELNRQMNKTLEDIAKAIFKSWFIDFDPVRAKMEGRQPVGMSAEIADLFPAKFQIVDGTELPTGWVIKRLGETVTYLSRGIQPKYCTKDGITVINQKCIRDGKLDFMPARMHDHTAKPVEERMLQPGDVLVNSTGVGTLGRVAQVFRLTTACIVDSHVTVVRASEDIISSNVLGLEMLLRQAEVELLGEGSTGQTELGRERLKSMLVNVAPRSIQRAYDTLVKPIKEQIFVNEQASLSLAKLRDLLLPKLLSGELRVKEAEKELEQVL